MRTFPDIRMRGLLSEAGQAFELMEQGQHARALQLLSRLRTRARRLGLESAQLAWATAFCQDVTGDTEAAFATVQEGVRADPFNRQVQSAFDGIAWRLRGALADEVRALDDPSTPRIYRALMEAGEADVACHVAMAKHHSQAGRHAEAMRILEAVTLLAPVSRDAWLAKAEVARALGDEIVARECEGQANGLVTKDTAFGIPGFRAAC